MALAVSVLCTQNPGDFKDSRVFRDMHAYQFKMCIYTYVVLLRGINELDEYVVFGCNVSCDYPSDSRLIQNKN